MPTYEYRCKACGHQLEIMQAFTDAALTTCPVCAADDLRKVFGSVGIAFKGSGFYKNDSRSKSSAGAAPSSTNGTATKEGSDSSASPASSDGTSTSAPTPSPSTPSPSAAPA